MKFNRVQFRSGIVSGLFVGLTAIGSAGCGDQSAGVSDDAEQVQSAITGGWTTLTLENGWTTVSGTMAPAVALVNGTTTFRGVLNGTNSTNRIAFHLPTAFYPYSGNGADTVSMRVTFKDSGGGTMTYNNGIDPNMGDANSVIIVPDAGQPLAWVSLDGVAFDRTGDDSTEFPTDTSKWVGRYARRVQGPHGLDTAVMAKNVGGFVRFQGFLLAADPSDPPYMFTIDPTFRTNQSVTVPVSLGGDNSSFWGQITIYPNGDVYFGGNAPAAGAGTSFEGAFYSKTVTGNSALTLKNGWTSGARQARVGNYGGVIRFQGSISGGTNVSFATLPSTMRPPKDIQFAAAAYGAVPVNITVEAATGNMKLSTSYVPLSVSTMYVSLDGLSFGI
jgi:hypothetical protein